MILAKRDNLIRQMTLQGLTGAGLARKAKVSQGYIVQVINGKRTILAPTAKKICDTLQCQFDDIFVIDCEVRR